MKARRIVAPLLLALALLPGAADRVMAQPYPTRPVKLVVPFPPGGANDTAARVLTTALASVLGQPVIIENQAGAGGTLAAKQVASSAPDGYTLLMVVPTNTFGTAPHLYKLDFDPAKSLAPVALLAADKQVMVVGPSVPIRSVQSLLAHARANPGKLNYGSATGTGPHFLMEVFKLRAGADIAHIPYRGGAPMINDLLGSRIDMTINGKSVLLPHIIAGKLEPLAVSGADRWPELPDVPTMLEYGYQDWAFETLFGVVAPSGTPAAVIDRLNRAINAALGSEKVRTGFAKLGIEARTGTPQEFAQIIAQQGDRWAKLVTMTGIKLD
jgi:tripartite-type tricarboxylate transporter receptor subunit TctC